MKVDCLKKSIDFDKIRWTIEKFEISHLGNKPSYIVMNFETKAEIIDNNYYDISWLGSIEGIRRKDIFFGIPVAFNEGLKFGEVDIV